MELNKIYNENCIEGMKGLDSSSVDLIVTDPPYGISFMGKTWDKAVPSLAVWEECIRILKSGAFGFIMSIPRLDCQFEMAKRLKLAGFNIGFTPIYWAYSSGFPKSMNISKKVIDFLGAERDNIPTTGNLHKGSGFSVQFKGTQKDDMPRTQKAKELDGSYAGFHPKPAVEVIMVAMKPLNKENYTQQALYNKKGITWLDDCRIPFENNEEIDSEACPSLRQSDAEEKSIFGINANKIKHEGYKEGKLTFVGDNTGQNYFAQYLIDKRGRFPANLLVSDDVLNDGKISQSRGGMSPHSTLNAVSYSKFLGEDSWEMPQDSGSFSRYFSLDNWWQEMVNKLPDNVKKVFPFLIVPKASSGEKNENLEDFKGQWVEGSKENKQQNGSAVYRHNFHPSVKPIDLMSYLITIGSRENDLVLDPFMGSGTTAISCRLLNRKFIGFEMNKEYWEIAQARLKKYMQQMKLNELEA